MSDTSIGGLARQINAAESPKAVVYVAGGGTEVFALLLAGGGGSSTLLSGRIPYHPEDFRAVLGCDPGRMVDSRAARGLATAAFRHALTIRGRLSPGSVFGLGATSKLSTGEGEREGRSHEIHAAIHSASRSIVRSATLPAGSGRAWEERINALFLLNLLAVGKGVPGSVRLEHEGRALPDPAFEERSIGLADLGNPALEALMVEGRGYAAFEISGGRPAPGPAEPPLLLLPGSFRPLHEGHAAMARAASSLTGLACGFELSLSHPDKPPLDYLSIRSRLDGFAGLDRARVYLTEARTYLDKARLFPGCTFAVGLDTLLRIVAPHYYGGPEGLDAVLDELEALGTRFLVFGRADDSGVFREFDPSAFDPPVVGFLVRAARPVPEGAFRVDLSSTQVRERTGVVYD